MIIRAHDGGSPPRESNEGRVCVEVTRNKFLPVFTGELPYEVTVNENEGVNDRIFTVRATDDDPEVCTYLFIYIYIYYMYCTTQIIWVYQILSDFVDHLLNNTKDLVFLRL